MRQNDAANLAYGVFNTGAKRPDLAEHAEKARPAIKEREGDGSAP